MYRCQIGVDHKNISEREINIMKDTRIHGNMRHEEQCWNEFFKPSYKRASSTPCSRSPDYLPACLRASLRAIHVKERTPPHPRLKGPQTPLCMWTRRVQLHGVHHVPPDQALFTSRVFEGMGGDFSNPGISLIGCLLVRVLRG
jgi:hypothetical protein